MTIKNYKISKNISFTLHFALSFFIPRPVASSALLLGLIFAFSIWPLSASASTFGLSVPSNNLGLIGHWTLDGADMLQNVRDRSGQGNHGAMAGFTSTSSAQVPGKIGQGLQFDGSDDSIRLTGPTFGNSYTLVMWIKPTGFPLAFNNLIGQNNANAWQICVAQRKHCFGSTALGDVAYSNTVLTVNTWTHVAMVVDAGDIFFYTNGESDGSDLTGTEAGFTAIYIGKDNTTEPYQGTMDDIRIYNRALSATEIKRLYNATAGNKQSTTLLTSPGHSINTDLVSYWTFDGPDMIQNIADKSGNGHHGNLMNNTGTTTSPVAFDTAATSSTVTTP